MFDIFGRKRIRELEEENAILRGNPVLHDQKLTIDYDEYVRQGFEMEMLKTENRGLKEKIYRRENLINFVTVNKPAKRRNDVFLASVACGSTTITPVMEYLNRKGIKDPDGGDYKRSTVQDILKPPATK